MSLMFAPLRKYATFRGRARRKEFWLWQLFIFLLFSALYAWLFSTVGTFQAGSPEEMEQMLWASPAARIPLAVIGLTGIGIFLPSLAVQVRRLHDSNKSGWWLLITLTGIGSLILLIFYLLDGTPGPNRHGADPKGRTV